MVVKTSVTIGLEDLVDLFERIDNLERDVRDLKERVSRSEDNIQELDDRTIMDVHIGGGRL